MKLGREGRLTGLALTKGKESMQAQNKRSKGEKKKERKQTWPIRRDKEIRGMG